jgi:hydroxyacylglutathione hydrolase
MLTFSYEPVSKRITRIYGFLTEMMYLVEGDEEVALIDTGSGLGSLKKVVDEILLLHGSQDKSIKVLLTHGHIDHALGAWEFDKIGIPVYMNRVDDYVYRTNSQDSFREAFMPLTDFEGHGVYENEDYIPAAPLEHFHNLTENDSFDLGNVTITAYECPGHTKGSMTFLIKENDGDSYLFTGDAGNGFTFLYQNYSTSVEEYEESLKSLKEKVDGRYNKILISHEKGMEEMGLLEDLIEICEKIKFGKTEEIPFTYNGSSGLIARKPNPECSQGNIVFHKDRIWKKNTVIS